MSKKVKLGEIASFQTGPFGTQLKASEYSIMGTPVINVKNIGYGNLILNDMDYVPDTVCSRLKNHLLKEGDIVFGRKGSVDRHCYIKEENENWMQGSDCIRVRLSNEVNARYISYYLMLDRVKKQINNASIGSTMASINTDILKTVEIVLPYLEKQNLIVDLLSKIDEKIENNNKVNLELESMAKIIYDYWFLQFDFPDENGKPYKSSGGKMVWNEELKREIPEGWKCDMLMEYISLTKGISYTSKNIESGKGVPMINLASIDINRNYKPNELKFYDGEYNCEKEVSSEDMLIACTDLTRNANIVGSPILVPNIHEKYLYSMDLAKIDLVTEELEPMYLYMTLRTEYYHNYIKGYATGTNVMHLNTNGISWFRVCFPPIKMQKKFSLLVKEIHEMKCKLIQENQELTELRDFLLPLLMNGQVGFK